MHDKQWVMGIFGTASVSTFQEQIRKAHITFEFRPNDERKRGIFLKYVVGHFSAHQVRIKNICW